MSANALKAAMIGAGLSATRADAILQAVPAELSRLQPWATPAAAPEAGAGLQRAIVVRAFGETGGAGAVGDWLRYRGLF